MNVYLIRTREERELIEAALLHAESVGGDVPPFGVLVDDGFDCVCVSDGATS